MITNPPIFGESGTLAGVAQDIDFTGFVANQVEVQNLDSANTYTLTVGAASIEVPPQRKVVIKAPRPGLTGVTLNGTGDFQVLAAGDGATIELSALDGLTPENAGAIQSQQFGLAGFAAGVDIASTFLFINNSPDKTLQILAADLIPKSTVTTLGGGQTCLVEMVKTGGNDVIVPVTFDDNPGGAGVNWPAYTGPGELFPLPLVAIPADLLLAPGEALFANVTQTAAAAVGAFALQVDYRVLV